MESAPPPERAWRGWKKIDASRPGKKWQKPSCYGKEGTSRRGEGGREPAMWPRIGVTVVTIPKKKNILQACILSGYIDFLYFVRTSSFTSTIDTAVSRNTFYLPLLIISVSIFFVSSEAGLTAGFLACDATLSSVCTRCGVKIDQEWMNGWFRLRPSVMARRCGSIILLIRVSAPKPQGCTRSAALCNLLQVPTSIFKIYMGNDQKRVLYPGIIPGRFRAKKRAQRRTKSNAQPTSHAIWARTTRTRFWSEKLKAPF